MELALFTPGAFCWPVQRSFESFIATLGTPIYPARSLSSSTLYPLRMRPPLSATQPGAFDQRLISLHQDLFKALLKPVHYFRNTKQSIAQFFWPDLISTAVADLISALMFYFVRQTAMELSVVQGLAVLRAAFFNHEVADPRLWLTTTKQRLKDEQAPWQSLSFELDAPFTARESNLELVIAGDRDRPHTGASWIVARTQPTAAGRIVIKASCGLDPSLDPATIPPEVRALIQTEVWNQFATVFGWHWEIAA